MTTRTADRLVTDYLARLDRAAAALPPDRRAELLDEIGDHIATSRERSGDDEAAVRTLLDRLGSPEEIVAAARDDAPPVAGARRGLALEHAAVAMLTLGSLLPVLGWLVGVLLLWVSTRWTLREKLLGTLVVPGGPGAALLLGGLGTRTCGGASSTLVQEGTGVVVPVQVEETCTGFAFPVWIGIPLLVLVLVGPVVVGAVLLRRARARA